MVARALARTPRREVAEGPSRALKRQGAALLGELQGYVLYSEKRKLKPALQGLSQQEIRSLRLAGEVWTDVSPQPHPILADGFHITSC